MFGIDRETYISFEKRIHPNSIIFYNFIRCASVRSKNTYFHPNSRNIEMEFYERRDAPFDGEILPPVSAAAFPKRRTEIQNFYAGKTILITGGSGFLGILLIEKLLRSCSDLKKIILLLREKKGKSIRTRIREIFRDEVFEEMAIQNPNYRKQVQIVCGSCEQPNLGLEDEQIKKLQAEVDIIFHSAANVKFDEHIRTAYEINVGGTKTLLEIAKGTKNLKAFIYVSTAYSQSHLPHIEEKFYPGALSDEEMLQFLKHFDNRTLGIMTPKILNGRFNTYTLTKGIAEEIVGQYRSSIPVAVFRPSIATVSEPLTCWTNNLSGATGVFVGSGVGFLRTLHCDPNCKAEIIPADRVISGLIIVPFHIQKYWYSLSAENRLARDPVYNFVTDQKECLTWGTLMNIMESLAAERNLATDNIIWVHRLTLDGNRTIWLIKYYLFHLLPAPFFIWLERITKQKPRIWLGYVKLFWYTHLYSFFMIRSWKISDSNCLKLYSDISPEDKILFNCDTRIDWKYYLFYMTKGLGRYILKFDWNDDHKAKIRITILWILDKSLIWTIRSLIFILLMKIILRLVSGTFDVSF